MIESILENENVKSISGLQAKVLHNPSFIGNFIHTVTKGVTEIFRDTAFYLVLRQNILPALKALSHCKVWVTGVGTGYEVVSLAILFSEGNCLKTWHGHITFW